MTTQQSRDQTRIHFTLGEMRLWHGRNMLKAAWPLSCRHELSSSLTCSTDSCGDSSSPNSTKNAWTPLLILHHSEQDPTSTFWKTSTINRPCLENNLYLSVEERTQHRTFSISPFGNLHQEEERKSHVCSMMVSHCKIFFFLRATLGVKKGSIIGN